MSDDYVRFRPAGCCTALQMQRGEWLRSQPEMSDGDAAALAAEWEVSIEDLRSIYRGELWCSPKTSEGNGQ